jgi:hypothetical protein
MDFLYYFDMKNIFLNIYLRFDEDNIVFHCLSDKYFLERTTFIKVTNQNIV